MAGFDNDIVYGQNADYSNTLGGTGASTIGQLLTNGQMWIGTTLPSPGGTFIKVGTLTSPRGTITIGYTSPNITLDVAGGGTAVEHLTGNTGGQLNPDGSNNFNIITANSTVEFVGSGSTLTQDFAPLGAAGNIVFGNSLPALAGGVQNNSIGFQALQSVTSGSANCIFGYQTGASITSASGNTLIGTGTGTGITTGNGQNTVLGNAALVNLLTGDHNLILGASSANTYTSSESNNIIIENIGVVGESNVLRIGNQGSGTRQVNQCFIAGIVGVTNSNAQAVTIDSTSGKLGVIALPTTQTITITGSLTNAQIKSLHASPIQVIAAPGSGSVIKIIWASVKMIYGGNNAFTDAGGGGIALSYNSTTTSLVSFLSSAAVTATSTQFQSDFAVTGTFTNSTVDNQNITIFKISATEIAGNAANDNTITYSITYQIVTI